VASHDCSFSKSMSMVSVGTEVVEGNLVALKCSVVVHLHPPPAFPPHSQRIYGNLLNFHYLASDSCLN
jgi:hypothetical protein